MARSRRAARRDRSKSAGAPNQHHASASPDAPGASGALRRAVLWGLPALVAVAGLLLYFVWDAARPAGITFVAGTIAWLVFALSDIGARVKPQDRSRAGAIDFGTRR